MTQSLGKRRLIAVKLIDPPSDEVIAIRALS